jgi:hypothetical protein
VLSKISNLKLFKKLLKLNSAFKSKKAFKFKKARLSFQIEKAFRNSTKAFKPIKIESSSLNKIVRMEIKYFSFFSK